MKMSILNFAVIFFTLCLISYQHKTTSSPIGKDVENGETTHDHGFEDFGNLESIGYVLNDSEDLHVYDDHESFDGSHSQNPKIYPSPPADFNHTNEKNVQEKNAQVDGTDLKRGRFLTKNKKGGQEVPKLSSNSNLGAFPKSSSSTIDDSMIKKQGSNPLHGSHDHLENCDHNEKNGHEIMSKINDESELTSDYILPSEDDLNSKTGQTPANKQMKTSDNLEMTKSKKKVVRGESGISKTINGAEKETSDENIQIKDNNNEDSDYHKSDDYHSDSSPAENKDVSINHKKKSEAGISTEVKTKISEDNEKSGHHGHSSQDSSSEESKVTTPIPELPLDEDVPLTMAEYLSKLSQENSKKKISGSDSKNGYCPPSSSFRCSSNRWDVRCNYHSDCPGTKLCCVNGCKIHCRKGVILLE